MTALLATTGLIRPPYINDIRAAAYYRYTSGRSIHCYAKKDVVLKGHSYENPELVVSENR